MRSEHIVMAAFLALAATGAASQEIPANLLERALEYQAATQQENADSQTEQGTETSGTRFQIWQYEYEGEPVFYLPLARIFCCDIPSELYDSDGELICKPDGGLTGGGDGRCPDFFVARSGGELVWGKVPAADESTRNEAP